MGIAGGEKLIRRREAWILLDHDEQLRRGLFEAPSEEMRGAYCEERQADTVTWTEAKRSFNMLDRDVGLARS
jgi:hypothetical protein